jgi:hypothetical protein
MHVQCTKLIHARANAYMYARVVGCSLPLPILPWRLCHVLAGGDLSPPREELLTQQGGTVAFRGGELVFKHADSGILKYMDVDEMLAAVLAPPPAALAAPSGAAETSVP